MEGHKAKRSAGNGRPLRVLHVSDVYLPQTGGIELHVHDLAVRQQAAGHAVEIVTATPGSNELSPSIPVHRPTGLWTRYDARRRLRPLFASDRFDVVHVHFSAVSPLALLALNAAIRADAGPIPTAVTIHSLWRGYTGIYRAADGVVGWSGWPLAWSAVSRAAAQSLERAARRPLDVDVVPNGIEPADWERPVEFRSDRTLRVASVMRFTRRKRPLPLLRMLQEVRDRLPSDVALEAVLIGDGPARAAMQRYVDRHGLGWIAMPGLLARERIADELSRSDVYAAPARLESFGIAALEAHLVGLPVVAMRGTGIADFIADGRDGRLCDSDQQMAQALVDELLTRRRISPAAAGGARADLSWPAVLRTVDRLYDRAIRLQQPDSVPGTAPQDLVTHTAHPAAVE